MDESDDDHRNAFTAGKVHQNQPYDESLDVPDSEDIASQYTPTPRIEIRKDRARARGDTPPHAKEMSDQSEDDMEAPPASLAQKPRPLDDKRPAPLPAGPKGYKNKDDDEESGSTDDEDDDDDDDDDDEGTVIEGAYNPSDYEHLQVSAEIKELFQYITRYSPQTIDLDHRLKPFIPDYIPAVGDIDAFIKVPRHDGKADSLGLTVLDEPCAKQSDPTVLDLTLRSITKQTNLKQVTVKSIPIAEHNPKSIDNWIRSIGDLHKTKPPPNVHYAKNMPDVDTLMQEWPPEFEELLKEVSLPSADLECDLPTYVDIICGLLDIPVHKSRVQSLHLLFTLYSEFKNSQHFRSLAGDNKLDNALKTQNASRGADDEERLVL